LAFPFQFHLMMDQVVPLSILRPMSKPIVVEHISFDCPMTVEDGGELCSTFCCVETVGFTACVL
jgi:hypothetical protein